MNNLSEPIEGQTLNFDPNLQPPAAVDVKPGYLTTQFHLTAIVALVCLVLSWVGIQQTPEQIEGYLGLAEKFASIILPIVGAVYSVVTYTNSRGKITSNAIWANAEVQAATLTGTPGLGRMLGGKNWKDPQRYINIAGQLSPFIPGVAGSITRIGASSAEAILDALEDDDLTPEERAVLEKLKARKTGM
jgi:hypothetical protein